MSRLSSDDQYTSDDSVVDETYMESAASGSDSTNVSSHLKTKKPVTCSVRESKSESGTEESEDESEDATQTYTKKQSANNTRSSPLQKKKTVMRIVSDSESEDEAAAAGEASHISTESESVSVEAKDSGQESVNKQTPLPNLRLRDCRLSTQFDFNSEAILNSTAIHPQDSKQNRLSVAFNTIQERRRNSSNEQIQEIDSDEEDNSSDIIEVSSDEEDARVKPRTPFKPPAVLQPTLDNFVEVKKEAALQPGLQDDGKAKIPVSRQQRELQLSQIESLKRDIKKVEDLIKTTDLQKLPDKGKLLYDRLSLVQKRYQDAQEKLGKMIVTHEEKVPKAVAHVPWEAIEAGAAAVLPKTFGKKAMSTYNAQKAVTFDRLQELHGALQQCPTDQDLEDDPKGIKVPLMAHQKRALAWLLFREKNKPSGGILADDMGLGKTLTMISLVLKSAQVEKNKDSDEENQGFVDRNSKVGGGTLIVCPASLLNQWSGEVDRYLKRGMISYYIYHGAKRETRAKYLAEYDMVITTYSLVSNEGNKEHSVLYRIKWRRIILDEAHQIRNYKAQSSLACCSLAAKSRWALTGTPVHNKELDMYALLKFLRVSPFDDLQVWKRWVGDKSSGGQERLHAIISSLMLRRTKAELMENGTLNCMPDKKWLLIKVQLNNEEMEVYHKILIFSQTLFAQFLHQRAAKNDDLVAEKDAASLGRPPNAEYHRMREKLLKLNKVKNVSQTDILVLLLRLRQICCHPSLITAMLDEDLGDDEFDENKRDHLNILEQLQNLKLDDHEEEETTPSTQEPNTAINLKEATRGHLKPSDPVFAQERPSSKINKLLQVLKAEALSKNDKAIIVSQWSSYLNLIAVHLKDLGVEFSQLDGKVPVPKRMEIVSRFNDPEDSIRILLLSLTAGGVGLNLTGGNHLFLLDLHWNPQLENQAQDRIYRVGQRKPVFIYKFMAVDTIEERIKMLQEQKLSLADNLLTGTKQVVQSKLSLNDLRMIFGM